MKFLLQRSWHTQVRRLDQDIMVASAHYMDSQQEYLAVIQTDCHELIIQRAEFRDLGSPGHLKEKTTLIPQMNGITAYLGSGPQIRQVLEPLNMPTARSLFNDCIIGIIQAETFLYKERGYASAEDYSRAWEDFYEGSCRYYSNPETIKQSWSEHMGMEERELNLFDRFKSQQLLEDGNEFIIIGGLTDTFHHMGSWIRVEAQNNIITQAEGNLLRCTDIICQEASTFLRTLSGQELNRFSKKELAAQLGAGQGCVHLIDLVYDSAETLSLYKSRENQQ